MSGPSSAQDLERTLLLAALSDPKILAPSFDSSRVFAIVSVLLASPSADRKALMKRLNSLVVFRITKDVKEQAWYVDMKKTGRIAKLAAGERAPSRPDVTLVCSDADLVGLAIGNLNPAKLYAAKRLVIRGDIDKALKVAEIISTERTKLEALAPKTNTKTERRWAAMPVSKAKL